MTRRVLFGGIGQESCSFVPGVVGFDGFTILEGEDILAPEHQSGREVDGVAQGAAAECIELIPTVLAESSPGPPVADAVYEFVRSRILQAARDNAGAIDGVMLLLHGAMSTQSLDDAEGDLVTAVRQAVGPDVPIVASLDLHCHFTQRMLDGLDALAAFHTHPHIDFHDAGVRAMRLLAHILQGRVRPAVAHRKVRMITSPETHNTRTGPHSEVMARAVEMEQETGVLATAVFSTVPWLDVPNLGWSMVVVTDGDRELAQKRADELATMAWERRKRYVTHKVPLAAAMRQVLADDRRPYILADCADSVSGGALGDGNDLLRYLIETGYSETAIMTVTDPEAVAACFAAGVGGEVQTSVGGKLTPGFYSPVPVRGRARLLSDGRYVGQRPPGHVCIWRTAVLQVGGISLLLSERGAMTIDAEAFRHVGLDPRRAKIVQAKSTTGFRATYEAYAADMIELALPGPCDSNLATVPYRRITRPLWPVDPELDAPW